LHVALGGVLHAQLGRSEEAEQITCERWRSIPPARRRCGRSASSTRPRSRLAAGARDDPARGAARGLVAGRRSTSTRAPAGSWRNELGNPDEAEGRLPPGAGDRPHRADAAAGPQAHLPRAQGLGELPRRGPPGGDGATGGARKGRTALRARPLLPGDQRGHRQRRALLPRRSQGRARPLVAVGQPSRRHLHGTQRVGQRRGDARGGGRRV
jgi:hypothetical protein